MYKLARHSLSYLSRQLQYTSLSQFSITDYTKIRNIGVSAHIDSGKTTFS